MGSALGGEWGETPLVEGTTLYRYVHGKENAGGLLDVRGGLGTLTESDEAGT